MRIIQLPSIGRDGRFGNSMLHYLVGKAYADEFGATVESPSWIGDRIFNLHSCPIQTEVPIITPQEYGNPFEGIIALPPFFALPHSKIDSLFTRELVRKTFPWKWEFNGSLLPRVKVAVHVRRGDYAYCEGFPWVEIQDINTAVRDCGFDPSDITWVQEDKPHDFHQYHGQFKLLEDFQLLMKAETVFVYPRSTFSQMASLLGNGRIYMPYDYTPGRTKCRYREVQTTGPVVFPSRNNSLD